MPAISLAWLMSLSFSSWLGCLGHLLDNHPHISPTTAPMLPASQRFPAALADRQPVKPAASLWVMLSIRVSLSSGLT